MQLFEIKSKKMTDLDETSEVSENDLILLHDGKQAKVVSVGAFNQQVTELAAQVKKLAAVSSSTTAINASQVFYSGVASGAAAHNSVYRGNYLGDTVTTSQYAAIADGTFKDLFIGDYWSIGSSNYRIAGFDYYFRALGAGIFPVKLLKHHVVLVTDDTVSSERMNEMGISSTEYGFFGSYIWNNTLQELSDSLSETFEDHMMEHALVYSDSCTDGRPTATNASSEYVTLLSEIMAFGTRINGTANTGSGTVDLKTVEKSQLPLFFYAPEFLNIGTDYWLRDTVNATDYAIVSQYGEAATAAANTLCGVRPVFCIC
jgi:hypothetical protein